MDPRLITTFPTANTLALIALFRRLLAKIEGNRHFPEPFPDKCPSVATLKAAIDELDRAYYASLTMDREKIAYRKKLCGNIIKMFQKLARYFEVVADGDLEALQSTGFELAKTPGKNKNLKKERVGLPEFTLKHGKFSGSITARVKKTAGANGVEVHATTGDPTVESNWEPRGLFGGCNIELSGFHPGQYYFLRCRWVNETGTGMWSPPYQFMAI